MKIFYLKYGYHPYFFNLNKRVYFFPWKNLIGYFLPFIEKKERKTTRYAYLNHKRNKL